MSNIQDYIAWRGDLNFAQTFFCDADSLVLCRLAYFKLDGFVSYEMNPDKGIPLNRVAYNFFAHYPDGVDPQGNRRMKEEDVALFKALADSNRFRNMKLWGYRNLFDSSEEKQFCAICAEIGLEEVYVAYRGTDATLAGWKEDFNMAFMPVIPSQQEALRYLEDAAAVTMTKNLMIGGHSKGGNLAVYAAAHVEKSVQERIITIYNHDGPGLVEEETVKDGYRKIEDRIRTFLPQSSIIGMLMEPTKEYVIVHSTRMGGLLQHDLYSWEILGKGFIEQKKLNSSSLYIDYTVKEWLKAMTNEQRENFVDALFEILKATEATSFKDIKAEKMKSAVAVVKTIKNMDKETREYITKGLRMLWEAAKETYGDRKEITG